jgi:hypothetical protein
MGDKDDLRQGEELSTKHYHPGQVSYLYAHFKNKNSVQRVAGKMQIRSHQGQGQGQPDKADGPCLCAQ